MKILLAMMFIISLSFSNEEFTIQQFNQYLINIVDNGGSVVSIDEVDFSPSSKVVTVLSKSSSDSFTINSLVVIDHNGWKAYKNK